MFAKSDVEFYKCTMLKGISDIDCVVILNSLPYLKDVPNISAYVERDLANAIQRINQSIRGHTTVIQTETNQYMVATLLVSGMEVKVDLLPTADNLPAEGTHRWTHFKFKIKNK